MQVSRSGAGQGDQVKGTVRLSTEPKVPTNEVQQTKETTRGTVLPITLLLGKG
jgi:hypothetical protein